LLVLLFLSVLQSLRWGWSELFPVARHAVPANGIVDLRGIDLERSPAFSLDGEWLFYPNRLLTLEEAVAEESAALPLRVPGDWSEALGSDSSYGYGTYRVRILLDPMAEPVAFWLNGIQASSESEINGSSVATLGHPAASSEDYEPKNISHTASYFKEGATEIDLIIRAANFDEPFYGGLTHTVRFGSQSSIDYVRWYSIGSQLITFVILLLHGLYAFILYYFNRGERGLLVTGLITLTAGVAILIGHDNVLLLWLPLNYTWAIKIRLISLLWQNLFILLLFRKFSSAPPKNGLLRAYVGVLVFITGVLLVAPASWANAFLDLRLFLATYVFAFAWFLYLVGTMIFKERGERDVGFLLLTAAGIFSNLSWSLLESIKDVTPAYYPMDILAAIVGFSAYWFKQYFRQSRANSQLNAQLLQADKLKDQFLANTSHELRTPLHGIMNIAQTIAAKEKDRLSEGSLKEMELLVTISRRMSHMLGDLLDVARLREHRVVLRLEPLRIQAIVPGVAGMLKFMTEGKPIRLIADLPEALPPVLADEKRLVQVLYNLLHNALKYTAEGTVSVAAEVRDGQAVVRVSDTGVGMDEETAARIFLPYEQGRDGVNDGRGIGLGLSISRELVELHGGRLTVLTEPGKGSTFIFGVPLADSAGADVSTGLLTADAFPADGSRDDAPANNAGGAGGVPDYPKEAYAEAAAALLEPSDSAGRVHILAVDDDPVNLGVLAGILSAEPYALTTVSSALEAVELLGSRSWDLLIADVMMPRMSGYELTQKVRERYSLSELPVLLLTARAQPADIHAGFLSGANDYATKPVDAPELRHRIRALVALKHSIDDRLRIEAAYLQAQIQPHFLFNTLNSLMALSEIDLDKMRLLGDAFASYLRISFHFLNTGKQVDLSHELELVRAYLYIEKERFEERLNVEWEVEGGIDLRLPPLSIQPLVENAVKHGLLSRNSGGTVRLRVARQEGGALVEVRDDGKGMEQVFADRLLTRSEGKGGIGLSNTNRRLLQLYGHGLTIRSKRGQGTTVSFVIPDRQGK